MKKMSIVCLCALLWPLAASTTLAQCNINPGFVTSNIPIEINYNPNGTWNRNSGGGVQGIKYVGVDFSAPGAEWQQVTIGFNGQEIKGNFDNGLWGWTTPAGVDIYSGSCIGSITTWFVNGQAGERFCVVKQEKMCKGDSYVKMKFSVTNLTDIPLERFSLIHGVDPDQDVQNFNLYTTQNDVISQGHLAVAYGVQSGLSIAYGMCDSFRQTVGFTNWSTDATPTIYDPNGSLNDITAHCLTQYDVIEGFQSRAFKFFVLFASDKGNILIEDVYEKAVKGCCCCCDLSKVIELPQGPGGKGGPDFIHDGSGESADKILVELVKKRILDGEDSPELRKLYPLLASPANLENRPNAENDK